MSVSDYSIVILSKDARNLKTCLESILSKDDISKVVVVDDGVDWNICPYADRVQIVKGAKPFCYATNVNIGLRHCAGNVILMNDDAALETTSGFTELNEKASASNLAVVSAAINGLVCNREQIPQETKGIRPEPAMLAFVCVWISKRTLEQVGLLDERYTGYGCEDRDYCLRVRIAGLAMGISDRCIVKHPAKGSESSYRARTDHDRIYTQNRLIFDRKWRGFDIQQAVFGTSSDTDRVVDILFTAKNRLEYTQEAFEKLLRNTDWFSVRELVVYDDGSVDGTKEYLEEAIENIADCDTRIESTNEGHIVKLMYKFLGRAKATYVAKIDSDTVVPPEWLYTLLELMRKHPEVHLLGIEPYKGFDCAAKTGERVVEKTDFIGGIGLFRRSAFMAHGNPLPGSDSQFAGFQQWQWDHPDVVRAWVKPGMPVIVLDKINHPKWLRLKQQYVDKGWQRTKPTKYKDRWLWEWTDWSAEEEYATAGSIDAA